MQYFASYVPLMKGATVLAVDKKGKTRKLEEVDAFKLKTVMKPGDELCLMMGSTNAVVAAAAFRLGVDVRQISYLRALSALNGRKKAEIEEERGNGKHKFSPEDIHLISQKSPESFYRMTPSQGEVLEIMAAWQSFSDAMEIRKRYTNIASARLKSRAAIFGHVVGKEVIDGKSLKRVLNDELGVKDEEGKKKRPNDSRLQVLMEAEEQAGRQLEEVVRSSGLYQHIFGSVDGVGPRLGARIIAAIERVERFDRPKDLSNYGGFLPRGPEGKLPSRKNSKGKMLSRKPALNTSGFLFQDQEFTYGRNTELGQMLIKQIERNCPCTAEQRKKDKDLRKRYAVAGKEARIAVTRYLLEKIVWPRWWEYVGLST